MKIFLLLFISLSLWANIGNILAIKGSAEVKRHDKIINAVSGMDLFKGDNILTSQKSRVQVMLNDETVVTIGASSSFSFEEFNFDGTSNSKVSMRASRGFFRSVTGRIGKVAPQRFSVKTSSATIGIRGTDFSGDISKDIEIFKCYQGSISIEVENDIQVVEAGMLLEISKDKIEQKNFKTSKVKIKKVEKVSISKDEEQKNTESSTQNIMQDELEITSMDNSEVPTESISDVTQTIQENPIDESPGDNPHGDDPSYTGAVGSSI